MIHDGVELIGVEAPAICAALATQRFSYLHFHTHVNDVESQSIQSPDFSVTYELCGKQKAECPLQDTQIL